MTSDDDRDLTSRSDEKRARRAREDALSRLAKELVGLGARSLAKLDLDEGLLDAVTDAKSIESPRARERQLRVVRGLLRDLDWGAIRARLDHLVVHGSAGEARADAGKAREWVVRLLGEGPRALDALIAEHPAADRRHLRDLVRAAGRGSPEAKKRAEGKLAHVLRLLMRE